MKALIVLLAVLGGVLLWRHGRRQAPPEQRPPSPMTQEMARCAVCGLHLPRDETVAGQRGCYCSAEHRRQAEG